jgi:ABC-type enterochelin transport system permease subunit
MNRTERETVMSYEEKGTWVYLVVAIVGSTVYLSLVLPEFLSGTPADQIEYVPVMLWVIGGAIVASIIGRILVEIFSPSDSTKGDIRDKEIDRLGERVGNSFVVLGALGALVLAMLDADGFWIANTVYLCFVLSAILSSITKLIAYRRGVPTW